MDRPTLIASERTIIGKKVRQLRKDGFIPGHVYGKGHESESVQLVLKDFAKTYHEVGETGLINLKIGEENIRPVLIREIQYDPVHGLPLNIDFYQVNLKVKVKVYVPIELVGGEDNELVHMGEAVVLQTLNEVEVEALPTDLIEKIEVNIDVLKNIDDAITVSQLSFDRTLLTLSSEPEEVVVKLAPAVTEEMKALMEEQAQEAAAAQETAEEAAGEGEVAEGDAGVEGGEVAEGETEGTQVSEEAEKTETPQE